MAEEVKTTEQLAKESFDKEEARKKAQTQFDPTVHGVGTMPVQEPESLKELWHKVIKPLQDRVKALEDHLRGDGTVDDPGPN